jgi:hypothetical protein
VNVTNSTFSGNSASSGGGISNYEGTTTLRNTIVANSTSGGNCNGTITDGGNNLDDGTTCGFGATSLTSTNPQLGALTGSPAYFPLNANSPAIDAGNATTCAAAVGSPNYGAGGKDQRGKNRDDLQCDIGAYERTTTDSNYATLSPSSSRITTYGPAFAGMQYSGTTPGSTTIAKVGWSSHPASAIGAWWDITPTTGSDLNLTLKLCFTATERGSLTEGDLRFWRYSGGSWAQVGGVPTFSDGTATYRCAQISGVTALSRWTLATGNPGGAPTAVTLSSFRTDAPSFDLAAWFADILRQWRR